MYTEWPSVAVCTLTADRRILKHSPALPHALKYPGDMWYYMNYQYQAMVSFDPGYDAWENVCSVARAMYGERFYSDTWKVDSSWRPQPQFDQDQSRLWAICMARNMCADFAVHVGADFMLFLDSDVKPPKDVIQRLLDVALFEGEVRHRVVGAMVPSRLGVRGGYYIHYPPRDQAGRVIAENIIVSPFGHAEREAPIIPIARVQNGTFGCALIHHSVFNWVAFRHVGRQDWYTYPKGDPLPESGKMPGSISEDPAFGIVMREVWDKAFDDDSYEWVLHLGVKCTHDGGLDETQSAQF